MKSSPVIQVVAMILRGRSVARGGLGRRSPARTMRWRWQAPLLTGMTLTLMAVAGSSATAHPMCYSDGCTPPNGGPAVAGWPGTVRAFWLIGGTPIEVTAAADKPPTPLAQTVGNSWKTAVDDNTICDQLEAGFRSMLNKPGAAHPITDWEGCTIGDGGTLAASSPNPHELDLVFTNPNVLATFDVDSGLFFGDDPTIEATFDISLHIDLKFADTVNGAQCSAATPPDGPAQLGPVEVTFAKAQLGGAPGVDKYDETLDAYKTTIPSSLISLDGTNHDITCGADKIWQKAYKAGEVNNEVFGLTVGVNGPDFDVTYAHGAPPAVPAGCQGETEYGTVTTWNCQNDAGDDWTLTSYNADDDSWTACATNEWGTTCATFAMTDITAGHSSPSSSNTFNGPGGGDKLVGGGGICGPGHDAKYCYQTYVGPQAGHGPGSGSTP